MSSKYCSVCGSTWGGYAVGQDQHYCRDGRRVFRDTPSESQQIEEHRRAADDPYQAHEEARAAWRRRYRVGQ